MSKLVQHDRGCLVRNRNSRLPTSRCVSQRSRAQLVVTELLLQTKPTGNMGALPLLLASFRGTVQHGLPLEIGDTVQLLEKCEGWYRGFVHKNPNVKKNEGDLFHRLWHVMNEILDLRRQVLVGHLTNDRMKDVKQHITARLDWGNEQLSLDLVPRREFSMVDPDEISVTELFKLVSYIPKTRNTVLLLLFIPHSLSSSIHCPLYLSLALAT
ncbi:unnamed protein product [Coregonus sp. 'balchen']|nr:unnamed protein product [Coregonus sp. 'balchen']